MTDESLVPAGQGITIGVKVTGVRERVTGVRVRVMRVRKC